MSDVKAVEPLVWEATTPGYTRFITQSKYEKLRPYARRWYRPVCQVCATRPEPSHGDAELVEACDRIERRLKDADQMGCDADEAFVALASIRAALEGKRPAYWERPNGDAGDALDWALDHIEGPECDRIVFLEAWREGRLDEWPDYHRWLKVQHEGAKAAALEKVGKP